MFSISPTFEWSFSHLHRFNWCCWTIPKCFSFTQMFLILPKIWMKLFNSPKFDEGCWNYQMIPGSVYFAIRGKKWQNNLSRGFVVDGKVDTTSLKCERSCIFVICQNVENFCPNNGQLSSVGDVTASPASPYRTLMVMTEFQVGYRNRIGCLRWNYNEEVSALILVPYPDDLEEHFLCPIRRLRPFHFNANRILVSKLFFTVFRSLQLVYLTIK